MKRLAGLSAIGTVAAVVLTVSLAAPASATVTTTSITGSNYAPTYSLLTGSLAAAPGLELDGTYSGTGVADSVDSVCYHGTATTAVGTNSSISAGSFRVVGAVPAGLLCDLRAVPTPAKGTPYPTSTGAYPALREGFAEAVTSAPAGSGTVNASRQTVVAIAAPQTGATTTAADPTTGGLATTLTDSTLASSPSVFANGAELPIAGSTDAITVDGSPVQSLSSLAALWGTGANQPDFGAGIAVSASTDAQTGDTTVTTSEPLLRCGDTTLPASTTTCATVAPTGVSLTRVLTTSYGGRVVRVSDTFASKGAHTVDASYEHVVTGHGGSGSTGAGSGSGSTSSAPTWSGLDASAGAPFTVLAHTASGAATFATPAAGVTISAVPSSLSVIDGGSALQDSFSRSVSAAQSFTVTHTLTQSDSDDELASLSSIARSTGLAATIALDKQPATVSQRRLVLTGTVTPGQNGLPATLLASDGSTAPVDQTTGRFSLTTVLRPGAQSVVITGVDANGAAAATGLAVSLVNSVSAGKLVGHVVTAKRPVTTVTHSHGKMIRRTTIQTVITGLRVDVPVKCARLATSPCTARIALTGAHNARTGSAAAVLLPNVNHTVTVTLSGSAVRAYVAAHHPAHGKGHAYSAYLTLTSIDPDGSTLGVTKQTLDF